ncbi:carbohydrate binding family 9 domain-containing protein [Candidatus Poribacteria bacterium]|nr:carbohydrate binding family 9 domain-containing protein [Candidatus Poribacteria bacterium]
MIEPPKPTLAHVLLILVFSVNAADAQEPLWLTHLTEPIQMDGLSNEPGWQGIEPLPMIMYKPTYRGEPTEKTEVRVAYDKDYFYCSARCYDTDPSGIRVNSLYRDRSSKDDKFGIILDTFNDKESALSFWTTPAGVRGDEAIFNDGKSDNKNWDTYWDVAVVQNEKGWFVEMRIPFSSLHFQDKNSSVAMRLIAYRNIARKNERVVFPDLSPERGIDTPSRAHPIVLDQIYSQKPVYLTPYIAGGLEQPPTLNDAETAYHLKNALARNAGGDIKYNVTSNLTLDTTLNPDFAQAEADDQQVNLSRFSLFFPEKRQFFQERSGIFSFNFLGRARLFHSRRIGIQDREQIPIIGGARLVGRIGDWDLGFLNMQTARKAEIPRENFGVLRLRRQVLNPYSYAGILLTNRIDEEGNYNFAYGLDGIFRLFGKEYLTLKWGQTFEDQVIQEQPFNFLDTAMFLTELTRRTDVGFDYELVVARSGKDFLPGIGYTRREDFTQLRGSARYDWLMGKGTAIRQVSPLQFSGFIVLRNEDRSVESAEFDYNTDFEWKSGAALSMDLEMDYEDLIEDEDFPEDTVIPAGSYTYFRTEGGFDMPNKSLFRTDFGWALGSFFDGWRLDLEVKPTWNVSRHLEIISAYEVNVIRFPKRNQGFNAHVARLRTRAALNTHVSLNAFVQYNSASDRFSTNIRFRYNFREGNDLWLVYNENLNTYRDDEIPKQLLTRGRTVLLKYTNTFSM